MTQLRPGNDSAPRDDDCPSVDASLDDLLSQIPEWRIVERDGIRHLERVFRFRNFAQALAFTMKVGEAAEAADHHPALLTEWGKVTVTWWTHSVGGLDGKDFALASTTDQLYSHD